MKVIEGKFEQSVDALHKLQEDIQDLINAANDKLTAGEVVGVLEFVKFNLINTCGGK